MKRGSAYLLKGLRQSQKELKIARRLRPGQSLACSQQCGGCLDGTRIDQWISFQPDRKDNERELNSRGRL